MSIKSHQSFESTSTGTLSIASAISKMNSLTKNSMYTLDFLQRKKPKKTNNLKSKYMVVGISILVSIFFCSMIVLLLNFSSNNLKIKETSDDNNIEIKINITVKISENLVTSVNTDPINSTVKISEKAVTSVNTDPHIKNEKKVFCIIITSKNNLGTKAQETYEEWVNQCDNYRFISLLPDDSKNTIDQTIDFYFNNSFLVLKPSYLADETDERLTDKVYLAFREIYLQHPEYEWYLKADDNLFIFMKNLKKFLNTKNSSWPVTFGYDIKTNMTNGYHSGYAGYVLSKEAFHRIGEKLNADFTFCPNSKIEDVDVGTCLRKLGVYMNSSLDEFGKERFHPDKLEVHYYDMLGSWFHSYAANQIQIVFTFNY